MRRPTENSRLGPEAPNSSVIAMRKDFLRIHDIIRRRAHIYAHRSGIKYSRVIQLLLHSLAKRFPEPNRLAAYDAQHGEVQRGLAKGSQGGDGKRAGGGLVAAVDGHAAGATVEDDLAKGHWRPCEASYGFEDGVHGGDELGGDVGAAVGEDVEKCA